MRERNWIEILLVGLLVALVGCSESDDDDVADDDDSAGDDDTGDDDSHPVPVEREGFVAAEWGVLQAF